MQLKKIHPSLQKALIELGYHKPNELQETSYSTIKSGADVVLVAPKQIGKTMNAVMHTIQKLQQPVGESTRALFLVNSKEDGLKVMEWFEKLGKYNQLRVYFSHDKSDMDEDKNLISLGNDVIVSTPTKINDLFATAGFNLNTVRFLVIDDADLQLKNRWENLYQRLFISIVKTQVVLNASEVTEKLEFFVDKYLTEPLWLESEDEAETYDNE
ncbi:MAG: DEAD/DEAH box helicase [Flavobacterium sp.]